MYYIIYMSEYWLNRLAMNNKVNIVPTCIYVNKTPKHQCTVKILYVHWQKMIVLAWRFLKSVCWTQYFTDSYTSNMSADTLRIEQLRKHIIMSILYAIYDWKHYTGIICRLFFIPL